MQLTKTVSNPRTETLSVLPNHYDPDQVLAFAHKAAQALMRVVASKPNKFIIRGAQYLGFEDWMTLARFYGLTVSVEWCKSTTNENKAYGFESRAVVYHGEGVIVSAAESSCFRDEPNWKDKPTFQLKSMAQTRASAKALRNVLAWVAVLGGFKPTPAEEMSAEQSSSMSLPYAPISSDDVSPTEVYNMLGQQEYDEWKVSEGITPRQDALLRTLITEKITDEPERESRLANLTTLAKWEASDMISELLGQTA